MKKSILIVALIVIGMTPLGLYFFNFQYGLSSQASDWAAFGSYIGGIYGTLAFFAVVFSIHVTRSQFTEQSEDDVFYKSVEYLGSATSFAKSFVGMIQEELKKQSSHMARKVLCNNTSLISHTNMGKIVRSINLGAPVSQNQITSSVFLDEIDKRQNFDSKWEYLKYVLGGINCETPEVKESLMSAGKVSFYRASFDHRKDYYDIAWQNVEQKYSEKINIYLRKFDFILYHVVESKKQLKYKKYLLSQISKYDIILLYFFALTGRDPNFSCLLLKLELLDDVQRNECRWILFDCPSKEEVVTEIDNVRKKINKSFNSEVARGDI